MSYTVEAYANENIVISTLYSDFHLETEGPRSSEEVRAILDAAKAPMYFVTDSSRVKFSLDDTIKGSSLAARGDNPIFHHPNVKQVLMVVGDDAMQAMTADGMQTEVYGNVNVKTFATLEDALAFARGR
jgi:hypothetical protein